jgi:nucleoside-diphosphate-sugar epimerase
MATRKLIIGCGYLGRRVARRWIAQGDAVFALTRSTDRACEFRDAGIQPIVGDVTDSASFAEFPAVDTLLYAVGLDRDSGKSQREVSVGGLENVLGCVAGKVQRFLYISSTSVYGQKDGEWVDESSECRPDAENGKVCLEAERLLRNRVPEANILRLAGIYGPGRLVARIAELRAGLVLEGNPEAWLNLIHVDDAVAATLACEQRGTPGSTYLVCDDRPSRRLEYYSLLAALIGAPPPENSFPPFSWGGLGGAGEVVSLAPNPERQTGNLNKRCHNRRLHEDLRVTLHYPTIDVGLPIALTTRTDVFPP